MKDSHKRVESIEEIPIVEIKNKGNGMIGSLPIWDDNPVYSHRERLTVLK